MKLNLITITLLSIFTISCNKDNEIDVNDFKGFYRIESISSSLNIDLNNDGIKTHDYLQEIKSEFTIYNNEIIKQGYHYDNSSIANYAEARPTKYNTNKAQLLDLQFPFQTIDSIDTGDANYVITYIFQEKMYTGFTYKLINDNVELESDSFNYFAEYYNINNFEINRINTDEFEVNFDYKVYDFSVNKLVETILKTKYKKIEH